jgi:hypothetical protein
MDTFLFARYRRNGGDSSPGDWESSAGVTSWEQAPAPAHVGKRLVEGLFGIELAPNRARLVNNIMRQFLERLTGAGVPAGTAELLITREWAILAGENDYTTDTFEQITGRPPRPVAEFLHDYRAEFV